MSFRQTTCGNHQAAQASRLLDALQDQLDEMTAQLAWIERQDVTPGNARAYAMRAEAAALRRDTQEAQLLIDRLQSPAPSALAPSGCELDHIGVLWGWVYLKNAVTVKSTAFTFSHSGQGESESSHDFRVTEPGSV